MQLNAISVFAQAFDGVFTVNNGNNDIAILWQNRPVHHHLVTFLNARANHRVTTNREHVRRRLVANQVTIEV